MPIRRTINQNIPFLTSYQPYTLPSGTVECFTVRDMYDYNAVPVSFDYFIGESKDTVDFIFKNLTNETTLEVNVKGFTSNALVLSSSNNVQSLVLKPLESQSLKFKLNTAYLDRYDLFANISGTINLNIKNVFNNTVSTKTGSVSSGGGSVSTPTPTPSISGTQTTITPTPSTTTTPSLTQTTVTPTPSVTTYGICQADGDCRTGYFCDLSNPTFPTGDLTNPFGICRLIGSTGGSNNSGGSTGATNGGSTEGVGGSGGGSPGDTFI